MQTAAMRMRTGPVCTSTSGSGAGASGLAIEEGGGVDRAPWLAPPPPPKRGSIDRTPKILLRLTPGLGGDPDPKIDKK